MHDSYIIYIMSFSRRIILFFIGFIIGILILFFFSHTFQERSLNIKKKKIVEKKDVKYFYKNKKYEKNLSAIE